jgi:2',3'-cyclic-nucleotide 2'-phosphodiesterase
MKILYLGDVVGRSGRTAAVEAIPALKRDLKLDFVIVNGENSAHGFGITPKICAEFYEAGADAVTTGNHVWDQREIIGYIDSDPRLVRPANFPRGTPGRGVTVLPLPDGRKVLVAQVMGRLFLDPLDDPFQAMDEILSKHRLGATVAAAIVDIHAEATSEKMAMGHALDGRVSLVVGSHSHVPTADAQVLPGGTAYLTDAGMCGDYDSVIGMSKAVAISRFTKKIPGDRLTPADGEATVCGVYVETDDRSGLATQVAMLRIGGRLSRAYPNP